MRASNVGTLSTEREQVNIPKAATRLPKWMFVAFFAPQIALALALIIWQAPQLHGDFATFGLLVCFHILSGFMLINVYGNTRLSMGFVFSLTATILFGIPGAVILAPIGVAARELAQRRWSTRAIPAAAMLTIVCATAAACYDLIAPVDPVKPSVNMAIGTLVATVVSFGLNALLLAVTRRFQDNQSPADFWAKHSWIAPYFAAMGVVAMALAAAYATLGIVGILAFVTPAAMMRLTMKQYVDKTKDNVEKLETQNQSLQAANIEIRRVSDELRESYDSTLEALVNALDARDQETKGHSIRVSNYMLDIAREMGIREGSQDWIDMQRGSLLHDVGKIGVSDSILLKPGKLTPEEWEFMRKHPDIGYQMLHQVKFLAGAAEIILAHHERWDGKGYPRLLGGSDIPLGARIFSIVDTFDSMTSDRPYRKARSTLEAMNEILRNSGTQFDPLVVEAFLDTYDRWAQQREELHKLTEFSRAA